MASATLLHHHPASHQQVPSQNLGWLMPATGIEKLLELSTNVPLDDGELTPVQAWDALRKHPQFGGLEMGRLRALMETLVKGVKCYGWVILLMLSLMLIYGQVWRCHRKRIV